MFLENESETPIIPVAESPAVERHSPRLASANRILRDIAEIIILVATIYTVVNLATARAIVEGTSMLPNFQSDQLVVVNRLVYYFAKPARGDVIVLHDPEDPSVDFIKRVIGLPGDNVQINAEGRVLINGKMLDEPYIDPANWCKVCSKEWQVKDDEYFVLGDNRKGSHDSHDFGPIKQSLIVGEAWIRYWPLDKVGIMPHENYGAIPVTAPIPSPTPTLTPQPTFPGPTASPPAIEYPAKLDQS